MATEIGIDLGSEKTVIFSSSRIVLEQPSLVTVDAETFEPVYFGEKAKQTLGRTPDTLLCVRPIENGLIADYDVTQAMLQHYMDKAFGNKIVRPKVMATLPTGLTELQHHSLANVMAQSGGRNVSVIESPLAVAIGLEIDFQKPQGNLIVDIGAGTSDIAVLSLGGIVESDSFKCASLDFDRLIQEYVRKTYNIDIGDLTAETVKMQIGSVYPRPVEVMTIAKGSNRFNGLPVSFEISSSEIYECLHACALTICAAIRAVLERTPPELVADIQKNGLYLVGGGSRIFGMKELLESNLQTAVHTVEDPQYSVVKGAARALSHPELLKSINYQLRSLRELSVEP